MIEVMILDSEGARLTEFQTKSNVHVIPRVGEHVSYKVMSGPIKGEVVNIEHEIFGGQEKHEIFIYIELEQEL